MFISLNIVLDSISRYRHELHIEMPTETAFHRVAMLPREMSTAQQDCLYISRLSDALRMKKQISDFYCLCLRDRIYDERETAELLTGLIVINENLDLEQLFSEVQDTFLLINDWYQNMQDAIINQKSLQDIISMSEPVIGNFISVSDSALSLLAYTKNIPTDDPVSLFLIEHGYHSEETVKMFKKYKRYDIWMNSDGPIISCDYNISKYTVISKVFTFNETYFTHVVMTTTHREMTPGLLDLFSHLIGVLNHYIKRIWEENKDFSHVDSALVFDLMQRNILDRETVNERARIVGIRPDNKYVVMLLTGGSRGNSVFPGLMAQDIRQMFPRIRAIYYNCRLILFLYHPDVANYIAEQNIENKLNDYFKDNNVFCGISDVFDDLLELPAAYHQAELVLKESDLNDRQGCMIWDSSPIWSNIMQFNAYFASCLLDKSEENIELWKSSKFGKMLLELYRSDLEKNINNLEVLFAYLTNERRATETANALHMHRNNVVYRISRIEEMLNVSLDDKLTRLNLMMSFLMLKSSGMIKDEEEAV